MSTPSSLRDELEALKQQRGAAVLDGKPFDGRRLNALEAELEGLEDADVEKSRRDRRARTQTAKDARLAHIKTISDLNAARLKALDRAEKACREMVSAIGDIFAANKGILQASGRLGAQQSYLLDQNASERRLAQCVIAQLLPLGKSRSGFGGVQWFLPPTEAYGSWADFDRKSTGAIINILTDERNYYEH